MKKHLLTVIASAALAVMSAQADRYPVFFSSHFDTAGALPEGWVSYGGGRDLNDKLQPLWPEKVPYVVMDVDDKGMYAYSTSYYAVTPAPACADWLVTPAVMAETNDVILSFSARSSNINYMELNKSTFKVRMSEDGAEQASFPRSNLGSYSQKDQVRTYNIAIRNVKDKTLNFAFINDSDLPSLLGFNDIKVSAWLCEVENNTPVRASDAKVSLNARIMTPVPCVGFTAVLESEDGITETYVDQESQLGGVANDYKIEFEKTLACPENMPELKYTITITPNYEGAPEAVVEGAISRTVFYPSKVIVEEGTGTWCGFCPRGAVALDFFSHSPEYSDRFLGIAVHGGSGMVKEPMAIPGNEYLNALGFPSYPMGYVNRYATVYFSAERDIKVFLQDTESYTDIRISDFKYDPDTRKATVTSESRLGFNQSGLPLNMAVVVLEDHCKGTGAAWNQSNNFSGDSDYNLLINYSVDWLEYWRKFTQAPNPVKADKMEYNHVARGIYPSFDGVFVADEWECDVPQTQTVVFEMPENIIDLNNVVIATLMVDGNTGYLYSFDRCDINGKYVGVNSVKADEAEVETWQTGSMFNIRAAAGSEVRAYTTDGRMLGTWHMGGNTLTIPTSLHKGLVIINIAGADGVKTVKTIW